MESDSQKRRKFWNFRYSAETEIGNDDNLSTSLSEYYKKNARHCCEFEKKSVILQWKNQGQIRVNREREIGRLMVSKADRPLNRIMVLTGARQVGKTTIIRDYFPDYTYLSVENPALVNRLKSMGASEWAIAYPKAALDEVQKEPVLIEFVKSVYDEYQKTKYLLTGSSQLLLMQKVRESLAGRCRIYDIYPLTLPEIESKDIKLHHSVWQKMLLHEDYELMPNLTVLPNYANRLVAYNYYLRFGGYPALVNETLTDEERWEWLLDYVRTYLERDIRDIASIRDLEPFVKLQQAMAIQTGQTVTESSLANLIGVSPKTAKQYLNYLYISYQTIVLQSWSRNPNKRLVRAPKVHFIDHGVLQAVLQRRGGLSGNEYESAIVSEIYKQAHAVAADARFYHLRTQDGKEVDLLVETPDGYYAFEIKLADKMQPTDGRHLRKLEDIVIDKPILRRFVVSNDWQTKELETGITAIHAALLLG